MSPLILTIIPYRDVPICSSTGASPCLAYSCRIPRNSEIQAVNPTDELVYTSVPEIHRRDLGTADVSSVSKWQHNALQVSVIKNSELRQKAPTRVLQVDPSPDLVTQCSHVCKSSLSYICILSLLLLMICPVYRKAISPPARCLWCRNAWLPQKRRKTCAH